MRGDPEVMQKYSKKITFYSKLYRFYAPRHDLYSMENNKLEVLLFDLDGVYTSAATPSAGWKAAWRWAGHTSRRAHRRALYGRITLLAKQFGTGETWPPVSNEAKRGMERAFREIGIEGY